MAYTPVTQRDTKKKTAGYTPVAQRGQDLQSFFPAREKISRATANIRQREQQQPTRAEQIQNLSERDMSQDVISQGTLTLADRARQVLPKPLSEALFGTGREVRAGEEIIPGVQADSIKSDTGAVGFFYEALTKSDQRKYDELTSTLTGRGVDPERASLIAGGQVEELTPEEKRIVNTKELVDLAFKGLESLDFVPVLGAITKPGRTALKGSIMDKLVGETDPAKIETALNKSGSIFADNDTTDLAQTLAKAKDAETAQKAIDEFVQSNRKYTPVRERTTPATAQTTDLVEQARGRTLDEFVAEQGAVPQEMQRRTRVDNQFVSSVTRTKPPRIEIDAEIGQIRNAIKNQELNKAQIDELSTRIAIAEDAVESNPASQLMRYVSRSTGELPEVTGTDMITSPRGRGQIKNSTFGRRGDDIVTELGFEDVNDAIRALDEYRASKDALNDLKETLRSRRGERTLANKAIAVTRAATQGRRSYVKELRNQFLLKDSDVKKAANGGDFRTMSDDSFNRFVTRLEQRAVEVADTRQAKIELMDLLERRNFNKVENYRKTQGFPPVRDMNAEQLRQYADALEQFREGDEFLTQRQLEVVDRTDLKGIKTMREARERLLEQVRKMPGMEKTTLEDLQNIKVSAFDNLRFDTALAEANPYYNFVVNRTQTHMLVGEANYLEVQNKINELASAANKSRNRGLLGSVRQAIIPKHEEIVAYLEAPMADKEAIARTLTKEELDYANYIQQYYSEAYEHLVKIKELYGSRYVDQYFTHTRRNFLEAWSDDGVIKAMREWWTSHKEDQIIANIIDQDTGNILPKSKFFQYTLQRTGGIEPSKNVTRVFLQYAQAFERKRMFDQMIPEIDIYTQSLTPQNLTPKGLEIDRSLKTFINKYLNNKKGRRENFGGLIKQSGPADILLRMGNTMVSLIDLGLSLGPSVAASVGDQVMTYQSLGKLDYTKAWKRRIWDTGIKRMVDKNASKILKEAEPFIGRNIWTELAEPDQGIMEKGMKTVFGAFSQSNVEANKLFLLGRISKEELQAGKLSAERLASLRLEAGRWRDLGRDVKSIVGSTSVGEMITKYKGWAIPIARTNTTNLMSIARGIKQGNFKETLTSREAAETYRAIELSAVLLIVGSYVISEEEDETFIGQLKARIYMESMTLMGGTDPTLFLSTPRLYSFLQQLGGNIKDIYTLEQYQQDSQWGDEGDLKGVKGLQRQFTPAAVRQFNGGSRQTSTPGGGDIDFGFGDMSGGGDMGEVDFGFEELNFGLTQ